MPASQARTKRWTRLEYERLIDLGAFGPEDRLELLAGQLVVREPQGRPHSTGIRLVAGTLRAAFGPDWNIEDRAHSGKIAASSVPEGRMADRAWAMAYSSRADGEGDAQARTYRVRT